MISIVGIERVEPYLDGSDTGEVAFKLEKRYEVGKRFIEFIEPDLERKFQFFFSVEKKRFSDLNKAFDRTLFLTSNWLTQEWKQYILQAKHGMTTKASQERGDPAFVDTGAYFSNMEVRLVRE